MIDAIIKVLASYLLGSIVGGLLIGRVRGGVDIRRLGSGNAGGTNALRTQGKAFAFWVMLIDIGKGWVAARVFPELSLSSPALAPAPTWVSLPAACGVAVILGHVYPIWYGLRGGKGVATLIGVVLGLDAWLLVPMLLSWFAMVAVFGYVGLASMAAAAVLPVYVGLTGSPADMPLVTFGVAVTALITFTHRANIARMLQHREPRAHRLWLFGPHER